MFRTIRTQRALVLMVETRTLPVELAVFEESCYFAEVLAEEDTVL
jgi:hypothetical protein